MARTQRIKSTDIGTAYYHLMSRTNDRRFLFSKGKIKDKLVEHVRKAAAFSGIRLEAYTIMDNHFHIVCEVVREENPVSRVEVLRRIAILKGDHFANALSRRWSELQDNTVRLDAEVNIWRRRMSDISEFIKTFKEIFNVWYKKNYPYCGSIWSGRFTSTLIQDGDYLAFCKKYVIYNPIRAGLVNQACKYRWSWCADLDERSGLVETAYPETIFLKKIVQISSGKILGCATFISQMIIRFGNRLYASTVREHQIFDEMYSSHGWKLTA